MVKKLPKMKYFIKNPSTTGTSDPDGPGTNFEN